MHRDIKFENILYKNIESDYHYPFPIILYLSDFGLARELSDMNQSSFPTLKVGTPFTMAPEIFEGKKYTKDSDIFSIGCVFLKLLTGLYPGEKHGSLYDKTIDISEYKDNMYCSRFVMYILEGCLQLNPSNRIKIKELCTLLQASDEGVFSRVKFGPYLEVDSSKIINCV